MSQQNPLIGQLCANCKRVVLTEANISVVTPAGKQAGPLGICNQCVPKGASSIPPGMLEA